MNETAKTGLFLVLAVASVLVAWLARPDRPERVAYDDSGERLFAERDPLEARSLEIVTYDADAASVSAFKVAQSDGVWSIPSQENYPADAEAKLAEAAAAVVDLRKGPKVSDRAADHELYGVVDPLGDVAAGAGIGTRVRMEDTTGATMVDLIVGKEVKESDGLRYVRVPDRDRVYTARVDTGPLSTSFKDWIEDDLLQLQPLDIRRVFIKDYTIDEMNNRIRPGEVSELTYEPDGGKWTLAGLAGSEELNTSTVITLRNALDTLEIIGVHRKPAGLSAELRAVESFHLDGAARQSLQARGFYVAGTPPSLVSNQGETIVGLKDGVMYVLRFGEIALGEHESEAFTGEEGEAPAEDDGTARYLFVMAQFDETLLVPPDLEPLPPLPAQPAPAEGAEGAEEEGAAAGPDQELIDALTKARAQITASNERKQGEYEKAVEAGQARVAELNDRFADWYYVISNAEYRKIRLSRPDLVQAKAAPPAEPAAGP